MTPEIAEEAATGVAPAPRPERAVKVYDFRRPDKFSKDQIQTAAYIHETFARQATTVLSTMLRAAVHVRLASVDQLTYEEFIRSIPDPTTIAAFTMEPVLKGPAIMEVDPGIISAMVDRLFGGTGASSARNRELTDIEYAVIEGALKRTLDCLHEAWAAIVEVRPRLLTLETRPQFAQIVHPREMIVLATMECSVADGNGMINIALPYITIEPIVPKLSPTDYYGPHRPAPEEAHPSVASLPVTAEVCYEGERLALSALFQLRKGMLVRLPRYDEGRAFLRAGGWPVFELKESRPRSPGRPVYRMSDTTPPKELAALGRLGSAAVAKTPDALRETLQSFSAELGSGLRGLEEKMTELTRRQEELADHIAFPTADHGGTGPEEQQARKRPFGFLTMGYCETLAGFLAREHPQLVALVLSYLEPGLAACVLERIPLDMRADVTVRICAMNRTAPEILRLVEDVLEKKLTSITSGDFTAAGGVEAAVEILNVGTRGLEKHVVETMERIAPALAEEIKKRMFVFEDIVLLDRTTVSLVLKEVAEQDLLLSLKATPEKVRAFIWECLPPASVDGLRTRLEQMGRARLSDIDAAQQRIVGVIRVMEEEGKIIVAREGEVVD